MSTDLSVPGPPLLCACLKSGRIAPTQQVAKKDHSAWNHPWHIGGAPSIGGLLFPGMVLTPLGVCVASLALTAATDIVEPVVFPWQCTFARHLTFCQDSHWTVSLVLEMSSGHGVGWRLSAWSLHLAFSTRGLVTTSVELTWGGPRSLEELRGDLWGTNRVILCLHTYKMGLAKAVGAGASVA